MRFSTSLITSELRDFFKTLTPLHLYALNMAVLPYVLIRAFFQSLGGGSVTDGDDDDDDGYFDKR